MQLPTIFSATLGLAKPWYVTQVVFAGDGRRLDITIEYENDGLLACSRCGKSAPLAEAEDRTWYHSDFFNYETYLHTRIPRTTCTCGMTGIEPPWSRKGSRFTVVQ